MSISVQRLTMYSEYQFRSLRRTVVGRFMKWQQLQFRAKQKKKRDSCAKYQISMEILTKMQPQGVLNSSQIIARGPYYYHSIGAICTMQRCSFCCTRLYPESAVVVVVNSEEILQGGHLVLQLVAPPATPLLGGTSSAQY